jgi:DNA (cytosine-5)-methyltransferase 1
MKYISLFAGIGGFDLALNRLGHECVWANEWNKYAAEIYNRRFSDSSHLGEEKTERELSSERTGIESEGSESSVNGGKSAPVLCDTRDIRTVPTEEIPDHDLLVGGFPCQAFSIAGKRRGFDDTRGTLFFEIARILKDKQPKFFILENVKGLLSHDNGFTFKTIISTLTELGYDLEWQVLNSKNFGVPQNRERVFIVGHIRGQPQPQVFPFTASSGQADELQGLQVGAITARRGTAKSDGDYIVESNGKAQEIKVVGTLETDGWEKRHEQIRRVHGIDGISPTIPTGTGGGVMTKVAVPYVRNPYNGKQSETETGTIGTSVGTSTGKTAQLLHIPTNTKLGYDIAEEKNDGIRLEHPKSKTARGRVIKGASQSLKTSAQVGVIDKMRIRRLTPTECERLQGFPDGWTEKGINEKGEEVIISDTQRYKVLGNAVTVNVVYEVARRLNG